jgi:hypothetical protein
MLSLDQTTTLWAKAYNDCNQSTFKSGENHVWIRWYQTSKYFKMGLAKDGPPGGGGKSEKILNVINVDNPEFIQIVGPESKTPKIQIKYNRDGKICTVTLEPCDETKRTTQYNNCLTPGFAFTTQKDWVDKVMNWFKYKKLSLKEGNKSTTTPSTPVTDAKVEEEVKRMLKEQEEIQKQQELKDKSQIVENKQVSDQMKRMEDINKTAQTAAEDADRYLADAQKQMEEHDKAMDELVDKTLGITSKGEEQKIGGKKRRTKRRKSIRRKKGKKSKKH